MRGRPSLRPVEAMSEFDYVSRSEPSTGWPVVLEVAVSLESARQQSLDSPLRFGPCQRGLKGVEGLEEPVCGRQGDVIDESLCRRQSTSVERGNPSRERVDEYV